LSANFKAKRTAAASRGFLATARLSCLLWFTGEKVIGPSFDQLHINFSNDRSVQILSLLEGGDTLPTYPHLVHTSF